MLLTIGDFANDKYKGGGDYVDKEEEDKSLDKKTEVKKRIPK